MDIRKPGFAVPAILSGFCLAAALGCAGKATYGQPVISAFSPGQAAVGASVVISGSDFKGILAVSFGGMPAASYHVDSDNQITATLPGDAITGTLVVQNPAGLGTSVTSLIVTPAIDQILPASGPAGTVVTLTGSGFFDASALTIANVPVTSFTYNSPTQITAVVGPSATTGPAVLTASGVVSADGPVFTVN